MTKLNRKEEKRTLHANRNTELATAGFILIERERYKNTLSGNNKWDEQRVFISDEEILKLYRMSTNLEEEGDDSRAN